MFQRLSAAELGVGGGDTDIECRLSRGRRQAIAVDSPMVGLKISRRRIAAWSGEL
jgi:hypothetical protein